MDTSLDMASFNHYYRSKLKMSLTYQICNGYFKNVRAILDSDPSSDRLDVNETDEWWVDNEAFRRKSATTNIGIVSSLESNFPIVLPLIRGSSQLHKLARMSSKEIISLDYRKRVGRTSLMLCSLIEDDLWAFNIAQMILERPSASLTQKDSNGHNAVHYAVMYQRYNLLELFLNVLGDYGLLAQDRFGNTVFHLAGLFKNEAICQLLHRAFLKYRNEPTDKLIRNKKGDTPLVLCHYSGKLYLIIAINM
jgi:ankyrin repeat protein